MKKELHYIITEERYRTSSVREITSMRSVKDMNSITSWKWLCCFAYVMKGVANTSKGYEKDEKGLDTFESLFLYPVYQHF